MQQYAMIQAFLMAVHACNAPETNSINGAKNADQGIESSSTGWNNSQFQFALGFQYQIDSPGTCSQCGQNADDRSYDYFWKLGTNTGGCDPSAMGGEPGKKPFKDYYDSHKKSDLNIKSDIQGWLTAVGAPSVDLFGKAKLLASNYYMVNMVTMNIGGKSEDVAVAIGHSMPRDTPGSAKDLCGKCTLTYNQKNGRFMLSYPVSQGYGGGMEATSGTQFYFAEQQLPDIAPQGVDTHMDVQWMDVPCDNLGAQFDHPDPKHIVLV